MSIERIIKRLKKDGHEFTKSISTGNVIIKTSWGAPCSFESYNAAYNWLYKRKY